MASSFCRPLLFCTFLTCALFLSPTLSGRVSILSIAPNFTASYLQFIDSYSGAFLASLNNSFQARITNPKPEPTSFYFVIVHVSSNTIVWSANRNDPVSQSSELRLTTAGLSLYNDTGHPIWSTPHNISLSVSTMQLLESGNLILRDITNNTLWASFDFPTDVLVAGQKLHIGKYLISSVRYDDLSEGTYRLAIGNNDAVLQWNGMNYWRLSMDENAFRDTNFLVEYMVMNYTGVYLMGGNGEEIVLSVILHDPNNVSAISSDFQIVKLDHDGLFSILKFKDGSSHQEFTGPANKCRIPFICRRLGVCTVNGGSCQCATSFHSDPKTNVADCVPSDGSLALAAEGLCNGSSSNGTVIKYLNLRSDFDYFSNDFTDPSVRNVNLSACQSVCSNNCSCLGVFHSQDSGSCYLIHDFLGSILIKSNSVNRLGYIKTTTAVRTANSIFKRRKKSDLSILPAILLPSSVVIVAAMIATLVCSRRMKMKLRNLKYSKSDQADSLSSGEELDFVSIPGLPVRFDYRELAEATRGFVTQIGSGGFGTVYKGKLRDGTEVAVKKITCLGAQGKREFLSEISVIGKVHHVNLVRLKGFCTNGEQRFLVYEFMKRGSLDRTLFGDEPLLDWEERCEIALGTARGLAYLHSGCEHKILHCDIKPENILLHGISQVKISDFGLSKLLGPEQSGLFTTLRGTRGYLAPEWLTNTSISDRTDVYSYGMVLLEIVRGKKNSYPNNSYFPLLALELHEERRYLDLVDPRLIGRVTEEEAEKLVRVALCCVHEEPNLRPSMSNVVGMLEGGMPLGEPRMESLNFLRFYGRRFTESSRRGENSEGNELIMYRPSTSNALSSSYNSFSFMSSQEVSGPR